MTMAEDDYDDYDEYGDDGEPAPAPAVLTADEVADALEERGVPAAAVPYWRAEPKDGQDHPGDRVFVFPFPVSNGMYVAARWMMGYPSADQMESCAHRWVSVDGPMTMPELRELADGPDK